MNTENCSMRYALLKLEDTRTQVKQSVMRGDHLVPTKYQKITGSTGWSSAESEADTKMSKTKNTQRESSVHTGIDTATEDRGKQEHAATTEGRLDPLKILQKNSGNSYPPNLEGRQATLREIAEWLSKEEGVYISPQSMGYILKVLRKKVQDLLFQDPYIRDYLFDQGFDYVLKEDSQCT